MPCRRQVTEELPAAKALFTKASDILGYDLLDRATNGPKDQLDSTVGLLLTFVQCIQGRLIYSQSMDCRAMPSGSGGPVRYPTPDPVYTTLSRGNAGLQPARHLCVELRGS